MSDDDKKKLLGGLFENEINSLKDKPAAKARTEEKHSSTAGNRGSPHACGWPASDVD